MRTAAAPAVSAPRPRVASTDILRGNAEVEIDHRGTLYRLRVTSLGKLILTK
jgi:hemin uptake protein HemP